MGIAKKNRVLCRFLAWLAEGDLEVMVWRAEDETPILVSLVEVHQAPPHAVTLQVIDTDEGEQG